MAKNSHKKERVCEKIFKAFTSPVRTVRRTKPSLNQNQTELLRVKFSETTTHQTPKPITKIEPKKPLIARVDTTMKTDERFDDFIGKAKLKIRAMTNLGDMMETSDETQTHVHHHHQHHHVPTSHVHGEQSDNFSEFIKKAKMKLRSSSTISGSNSSYDSFNVVKD